MYATLKTSSGLTDDADYVGTQAAPADTKTVAPYPATEGHPFRVAVHFVLEWLDAGGLVVAGAGSFTFQAVKVTPRALGGNIVEGAAPVAAVGSIPLIEDDLRVGDVVGCRISGISAPGGATKYRVLYREAP